MSLHNLFSEVESEEDIMDLAKLILEIKRNRCIGDDEMEPELFLYCSIIGYIYYEAPSYELNMSTVYCVLEDVNIKDRKKSGFDHLIRSLAKDQPGHYAVRMYLYWILETEY